MFVCSDCVELELTSATAVQNNDSIVVCTIRNRTQPVNHGTDLRKMTQRHEHHNQPINKQTNLWQNVIHNVSSVLHVDVSLTEQVATALLVKHTRNIIYCTGNHDRPESVINPLVNITHSPHLRNRLNCALISKV